MISYDDHPNHPLRVCHKSFSDFIYDQPSSSPFSISVSQTHQDLANGCLDVLLKELKFNICSLETSYLSNRDVKDLDLKIKNSITPQLRYSSLYWANHLVEIQTVPKNTSTISPLANKLDRFFTEHLLHWFEVLSFRNAVNISSESLLICARWSKVREIKSMSSTSMLISQPGCWE